MVAGRERQSGKEGDQERAVGEMGPADSKKGSDPQGLSRVLDRRYRRGLGGESVSGASVYPRAFQAQMHYPVTFHCLLCGSEGGTTSMAFCF